MSNLDYPISLTIREAKILCLRFKKKTLCEIGKMFKVTPERIRQIEAKAIRRLERGIKEQEEKKAKENKLADKLLKDTMGKLEKKGIVEKE